MAPDELPGVLLRDEYLVVDIPAEEFLRLEKLIRGPSSIPRILPCITVCPVRTERRTIWTVGNTELLVSAWASESIAEGIEKGAFDRGDIDLIAEGQLKGLSGEYENITKAPDIALVPGQCFWPSIVFEFGYAEPYDDVKEDVKLLLEGKIRNGFVEVWHLRDEVAKKDGPKETLFLLPRCHGTQKLMLALGDILGDEFENLANPGWVRADTLDLRFDALRRSINAATRRHLIQEGVLEED
ncbi:hypothetical protein HOY82DRAFT_616163 [Tuber indicum]|nr:hypothetical protein HOY82DRAFT_616163 [Tuber indicum]